jgi:hypothetical protein
MSRKKAGQKHSLKIANRPFKGVAKLKYLGTTLTDNNCMQEEIKSRLNSVLFRVFGFLACCLEVLSLKYTKP